MRAKRRCMHGKRIRKPGAPKNPTLADNVVTNKVQKDLSKKAITRIAGGVAGKAFGALALGKTLYDMYKSGQETSGGKIGYMKNPNYDPNKESVRHGDAGSNAQFIPDPKSNITKGVHKKSIWEKGKEKSTETKKNLAKNKPKKGFNFGNTYDFG